MAFVRPSSILISVLLALLVVEIPARGVEDVAFDLSEISAIVEPMVRQARQQSTATVTVLKTVRTSAFIKSHFIIIFSFHYILMLIC
jgi:hypothetical protein